MISVIGENLTSCCRRRQSWRLFIIRSHSEVGRRVDRRRHFWRFADFVNVVESVDLTLDGVFEGVVEVVRLPSVRRRRRRQRRRHRRSRDGGDDAGADVAFGRLLTF